MPVVFSIKAMLRKHTLLVAQDIDCSCFLQGHFLIAGQLYDPETGLICGLRPTHFITLATPHLGCEAGDSPAQV